MSLSLTSSMAGGEAWHRRSWPGSTDHPEWAAWPHAAGQPGGRRGRPTEWAHRPTSRAGRQTSDRARLRRPGWSQAPAAPPLAGRGPRHRQTAPHPTDQPRP
eukprot:8963284-Alexandrium_andersonii.AAC.1